MQTPGRIRYIPVFVQVSCFCNLVISDKKHTNDDLAQQNIPDGSEFGWDFSVNVGGTTLFYCDMEWENVQQYHFDAYSFARYYPECENQCLRLISIEGTYGLNGQTGFWEFMYYWPN
ncbi:hypothetical protein P3X46_016798 [Hevea brasiliensis]|uniref:S-protein homolog n=1 Tax=Hevea brasiliensis TaxID=3981 RepID=A0ABQ9M2A9_HEVBR|nr:hypothetical protein P3X46_016798 [Hevea brasiliensis]